MSWDVPWSSLDFSVTSIHAVIPVYAGAEFPGAVLLWLAVSNTEGAVL